MHLQLHQVWYVDWDNFCHIELGPRKLSLTNIFLHNLQETTTSYPKVPPNSTPQPSVSVSHNYNFSMLYWYSFFDWPALILKFLNPQPTTVEPTAKAPPKIPTTVPTKRPTPKPSKKPVQTQSAPKPTRKPSPKIPPTRQRKKMRRKCRRIRQNASKSEKARCQRNTLEPDDKPPRNCRGNPKRWSVEKKNRCRAERRQRKKINNNRPADLSWLPEVDSQISTTNIPPSTMAQIIYPHMSPVSEDKERTPDPDANIFS